MGKNRFGIRSKIMIGYMFIIVCLTISFVLVNFQVTSMQKDRNYIIEHDFAVHNETNRIEKYVMDMESGQRGYLLTGILSYLEPYNLGESKWRESYSRLSQLTRDNIIQEQNLSSIKASIERWLQQSGGNSVSSMKNNVNNETYYDYNFLLGKQIIDDIRSQLDRFRSVEMGLTKQRAAHLDAQNQMLTKSLFVMLAIVLIFSIAASILISRSIVGTIKQVTRSIMNLSSSKRDRSKRIHVTINDEVRDLAEATNVLLENQEEMEWQ
ncbi:CHASE3 domain-containing protein [Paenibacillus alginolyticus]|nr:CHASE3 domain-containing protein [Paenibacillus alginolyticus]MEC0148306.1 CHASE3 domain-containing protein [Paenibacillus alginolyticus]